jgi:hypothetical protein
MSDADWAVASRECDYHIRNVRQLIAPNAFWVNDIAACEVVLLKMPQLIAAAQCGFAIPETLHRNDPDEIRRFWGEHRKAGVIFKLDLQTHWHAQSSGERHAPFTTELRQENLQDDTPLAGCPAIYQRKVEKAYELRVTCMDERCVAIRLDSQSRDSTRLDWRSDVVAPLKPALVALPRTVEERCIAPMRKLGLAFGCRPRGNTSSSRSTRWAVSVGGTGRTKIRAAPLLCDATAQSAPWAVDSARRG